MESCEKVKGCQSCDRLVIVHMINKELKSYFCDTIPCSGAKTPRLCLILATPVEVVVTVIVLHVVIFLAFLRCITGMVVLVLIHTCSLALVTLLIKGALQSRVLGIDLAADVADFWSPLHTIKQFNMLQ